jgi:hypothetical protein
VETHVEANLGFVRDNGAGQVRPRLAHFQDSQIRVEEMNLAARAVAGNKRLSAQAGPAQKRRGNEHYGSHSHPFPPVAGERSHAFGC